MRERAQINRLASRVGQSGSLARRQAARGWHSAEIHTGCRSSSGQASSAARVTLRFISRNSASAASPRRWCSSGVTSGTSLRHDRGFRAVTIADLRAAVGGLGSSSLAWSSPSEPSLVVSSAAASRQVGRRPFFAAPVRGDATEAASDVGRVPHAAGSEHQRGKLGGTLHGDSKTPAALSRSSPPASRSRARSAGRRPSPTASSATRRSGSGMPGRGLRLTRAEAGRGGKPPMTAGAARLPKSGSRDVT